MGDFQRLEAQFHHVLAVRLRKWHDEHVVR